VPVCRAFLFHLLPAEERRRRGVGPIAGQSGYDAPHAKNPQSAFKICRGIGPAGSVRRMKTAAFG
jgi:hypothetical protein